MSPRRSPKKSPSAKKARPRATCARKAAAGRAPGLGRLLRVVPGFPKPGIMFQDITPLLADARALAATVAQLAAPYLKAGVTRVVAPEARGFIFGPAVACRLGAGFVPARKPGKLPWKTRAVEYALEYGTDKLCLHEDAIRLGDQVLILDDLLATGGTTAALVKLVGEMGGRVVGLAFLVELDFLKGRAKLAPHRVHSLIHVAAE